MTTGKSNQREDLDELIISFVREQKPETVEELVETILEKRSFSREEIIEHVLILKSEGKLSLKETRKVSFSGFIFSGECTWFWVVTTLAFSTAMAVITIPENAFPLVYARYILGSLYVLFLPGYSFLRATFVKREFEYLEQIALSIVLSITLVFFTAFFLNYTSWGITLTPIVLILLTITLLFSIIALLRKYGIKWPRI